MTRELDALVATTMFGLADPVQVRAYGDKTKRFLTAYKTAAPDAGTA